jgi:two-component system response regulator YesN
MKGWRKKVYTYIIVDDENLTRKGTMKKLSPLSEKVQCIGEAANGQDALELVKKLNPDIIITDMNMPVLDGTHLLPQLTQLYPNKQIIVISGYKDFEYTKQAIMAKAVNYILKPFGRVEIQRTVQRALQAIDSQSALQKEMLLSEEESEQARYESDIRLLKNVILGYDTISTKITSKKLRVVNETHGLILISLYCPDSIDETVIHHFLQENGFGDLAFYLPHMRCTHMGFLVLFLPKRSAVSPEDLCKQVIQNLMERFEERKKDVSFGISRSHSDLLQLHIAFKETVTALNTKKLTEKNRFFFYSEKPEKFKEINWAKSDELLFRIEAGMTQKVNEMVDNLFTYLELIPDCTLADVKYYCFQLSDQIKVMMSYYLNRAKVFTASTSMQNVFNNMFNLQEIKEYYLHLFINITEMLQEKSIYATDDVVKKMQIYVQRNYKNNITIDYISSLFYLNRSYCSHLFREKTGEKFVDFLNAVRIKEAKQLLSNTDKKMYQIAKSVGYDNAKYFFRVFNKLEKKTPEQYRKEHRNP